MSDLVYIIWGIIGIGMLILSYIMAERYLKKIENGN
jgi:uncharacterized membrane protein YjfL (UPF0719 family)